MHLTQLCEIFSTAILQTKVVRRQRSSPTATKSKSVYVKSKVKIVDYRRRQQQRQ